jgi:succinate dehydrogenase / fumarate reductase flavoprotein subunit
VNNTSGDENPYLLWQEMGTWMTNNCTVVRINEKLEETLVKCQEWKDRYKRRAAERHRHVDEPEPELHAGAEGHDRRRRGDPEGALLRNESRGAHYKPAFPKRDDANFLKATIATYDAANDAANISYEPVDVSLVPPRARTYGKTEAGPAAARRRRPRRRRRRRNRALPAPAVGNRAGRLPVHASRASG